MAPASSRPEGLDELLARLDGSPFAQQMVHHDLARKFQEVWRHYGLHPDMGEVGRRELATRVAELNGFVDDEIFAMLIASIPADLDLDGCFTAEIHMIPAVPDPDDSGD